MYRVFTFALVAAALVLVQPVDAGKFNKVVSIGDASPVFDKLPGTDGKDYGLSNFEKKEVVVVVITCNHCPVAVAYEDRLIEFTKKFADKSDSKVGIVAINVNLGEDDAMPKMKERAKAKGFNFPYLIDESQQIARKLGARVTPEVFVLNKDRKIVYMGAFDDNMNEKKVSKKYVEDAVEALLKGEKIATTETQPKGCGVRFEKK